MPCFLMALVSADFFFFFFLPSESPGRLPDTHSFSFSPTLWLISYLNLFLLFMSTIRLFYHFKSLFYWLLLYKHRRIIWLGYCETIKFIFCCVILVEDQFYSFRQFLIFLHTLPFLWRLVFYRNIFQLLKGALIQNWKYANIFVFIRK